MTNARKNKIRKRRFKLEALESRRLLAVVFSPPSDEGVAGESESTLSIESGPLSVQDGADSPFDIQFNFGPNIRQVPSALRTMELAAQIWESYIADPVTLFIDMDIAPLGGGTLGQAS
ncbi:MAG: hypothetical protein AAF664_24415, partial [Planctomycetota bacterium]